MCSEKKSCGGLKSLILGALFGLVLGLLLAPKPGAETLNDLLEKKEGLLDALVRKLPV